MHLSDVHCSQSAVHISAVHTSDTSFGIQGLAFSWFRSYLSNRLQFVYIGNSKSPTFQSPIGVPQGSVLGPILFSLYISPIAEIAASYGLSQQQYADDTQLYIAVSRLNLTLHVQLLEQCLTHLHTWFCLNGLALNPDKSDTIIFGTRQRALTLLSLTNIDVAGSTVSISPT